MPIAPAERTTSLVAVTLYRRAMYTHLGQCLMSRNDKTRTCRAPSKLHTTEDRKATKASGLNQFCHLSIVNKIDIGSRCQGRLEICGGGAASKRTANGRVHPGDTEGISRVVIGIIWEFLKLPRCRKDAIIDVSGETGETGEQRPAGPMKRRNILASFVMTVVGWNMFLVLIPPFRDLETSRKSTSTDLVSVRQDLFPAPAIIACHFCELIVVVGSTASVDHVICKVLRIWL